MIMRKIFILLGLCMVLAKPAAAAPCYGTTMPGENSWFTGVEHYQIFQHHLASVWGNIASNQNFLLLSYGIFDWLSLDLKGGEGNLKDYPQDRPDVRYAAGFAGGYGLRLKLYDENNLCAVLGFQHISAHPYSAHAQNLHQRGILDDWQASILAGYRIKIFAPYAGVKWSRPDYIHWVDTTRHRHPAAVDRRIGLFAGSDIFFTDSLWLNAEYQFVDGAAFTLGLHYAL